MVFLILRLFGCLILSAPQGRPSSSIRSGAISLIKEIRRIVVPATMTVLTQDEFGELNQAKTDSALPLCLDTF